MIPTRSQTRSTSESTCEEKNTVRPSAFVSSTTSKNSSCTSGSRPPVGSSRIRSGGLWNMACMSPIFCLFPRESRRIGRRRSAPNRSASSCPYPRSPTPRSRAKNLSSPSPVVLSSRANSPGRLPTRARTSTLSLRVSSPKTSARPPVGRMNPSSVRMVVVLPAPFGPRKPKTSPGKTSRSTSLMPRFLP